MFGLSFVHILVLMAIGLIVLGPEQMPQLARIIGKTIAELKKALNEATSSIVVDFKEQNKKPEEKPQQLVTPQAAEGTVAHNAAKAEPSAQVPAPAPAPEPAKSGVHGTASEEPVIDNSSPEYFTGKKEDS